MTTSVTTKYWLSNKKKVLTLKVMIKINNLNKVYTTEEVETTALNNINVEIKDGEFVAIMGPSGCGKSTRSANALSCARARLASCFSRLT